MKDLKNFKNGGGESSAGSGPNDPQFNEAVKRYSGMGEDELISQLLSRVRGQKQNGAYNPAQMAAYIEMLRPHINSTQYEKLQNIIKVIDAENA